MTLSPEEMIKVYDIQRSMHQKFRHVNSIYGEPLPYLGRLFIVHEWVFWPSKDSEALVKNYAINPGEEVCDVCTGSGVIAVHSAWKGAKKVVALDINTNAIKSTLENSKYHNLGDIIESRQSDVFYALKSE